MRVKGLFNWGFIYSLNLVIVTVLFLILYELLSVVNDIHRWVIVKGLFIWGLPEGLRWGYFIC